jgi:hypothetical protein
MIEPGIYGILAIIFIVIQIYAVSTSSLKFCIERCPNSDFLLIYLQKEKNLILVDAREYSTSLKFHAKEQKKRNKSFHA